MNYLRDYYERALQEFGTSDDGEQSLSSPKKGKMMSLGTHPHADRKSG